MNSYPTYHYLSLTYVLDYPNPNMLQNRLTPIQQFYMSRELWLWKVLRSLPFPEHILKTNLVIFWITHHLSNYSIRVLYLLSTTPFCWGVPDAVSWDWNLTSDKWLLKSLKRYLPLRSSIVTFYFNISPHQSCTLWTNQST